MRWTSLAAVVRMLMPPWSGKSAQVVLDQEPSSLPHQENLRYRVLRNESDETMSEAEALRAHFFSQQHHSIECETLSAKAALDEKLRKIFEARIPANKPAEPLKKSDYKFYVDGLIELPNVERKALSQRGGVLSPASPTTVPDDTVTTRKTDS